MFGHTLIKKAQTKQIIGKNRNLLHWYAAQFPKKMLSSVTKDENEFLGLWSSYAKHSRKKEKIYTNYILF